MYLLIGSISQIKFRHMKNQFNYAIQENEQLYQIVQF